MKITTLMWAALTIVVGISLFMLKYQVQALEDQLHATYAQIEKDKSAIRVLQAEWAYLNDPGRLRRLSEQHLGFAAPVQAQIISLSQVPFKNGQMPVPQASVREPAPSTLPAALPPAVVRETEMAPGLRVNMPELPDWASFKLLGFKTAAGDVSRGTLTFLSQRFEDFVPSAWAAAPRLQEAPR